MILRMITLAAGIVGGLSAAQLPEFSQQYVQRLGGAVDALSKVVADFDTSATAEGLTRDAALQQMTGTDFLDRRRADMERSFARHARLSNDLKAMQGQGPFSRAYLLSSRADSEIVRATWAAYKPALPITLAGAIFAAFGFVFGGGASSALIKGGHALFRRRVARGT